MHNLAVDVDFTELVLDDDDFLAVVLRQDVVEQGGLPTPKENPVRTVIEIRSSLIAVFALSSSLCCCFCCSCCRANARSGNRPPLSARRRRRRRRAIIVPAFEREGESFRPSAKDAQRDGHIVVVVVIIIIIGLCGRWCCGLGRGCVLLPRVGKTKKKKKKKKRFCVGVVTQWGPFSAAAYHTQKETKREKKRPVRLCRVKTVDDDDEEEEEEEERTR